MLTHHYLNMAVPKCNLHKTGLFNKLNEYGVSKKKSDFEYFEKLYEGMSNMTFSVFCSVE
jgi:hypothetical protein